MGQQLTIPGGRDKGKTIAECNNASLEWWATNAREEDLKDACAAELAKRNGGAPPAASGAARSTALANKPAAGQSIVMPNVDGAALVGAFADPIKITAALMQAQQHYHVVTPAMSVGGIPEGCEIYTSLVAVQPYGPEVYNITGDRKHPKDDDSVGIDKIALAKIWAALGGTWQYSRRTDNNTHPHYCSWEAAGLYEQFDGKVCRVLGNVDIDVRAPHGPAYVEIMQKAHGEKRDPNKQLLELRKFLSRHCETKAMNKAISAVGVRRSYKRGDLNKPFLVARLAVTGRTDDPELKREFAKMHYASRLAGTSALYGAPAVLPAAAPADPDQGFYGEEYERQSVAYSMPQTQLGGSPGDIETQGESGSGPENDTPAPKSEPPAQGATATSTPVPKGDKKPNYAEGEADY